MSESTARPADDTSDDDLSGQDLLVREGDIAGDYLERLLDIADVDGDIDMDVEGERAVVAIVGDGLDALVGQREGGLVVVVEHGQAGHDEGGEHRGDDQRHQDASDRCHAGA